MKKIRPFLWYDDKAEEAAKFYVSIFKNSKINEVHRQPGKGRKSPVFSVTFELDGQEFIALNGGPHFHFTPAISLFVTCKTQKEVDKLWEKLSAGGGKHQCGWVHDKYGLSWQIIPSALGELMGGPDPEKSRRVYEAMLKMTKIDIAKLKVAYKKSERSNR
jgi:predicted 3-demethylubiquinone-9 3-methyltransferase (glyoxalase superfamily)